MKSKWPIRIIGVFVVLLALWGSMQVGVLLGVKAGQATYHNEYMRGIQLNTGNLITLLKAGDLAKSQQLAEKIRELALATGNPDEYSRVANECEEITAEQTD